MELGPPVHMLGKLTDRAWVSLYRQYNHLRKQIYYHTERDKPTGAVFLNSHAQFYSYALIDGRRITPVSESRSLKASAAVVKVIIDEMMHVGEVLHVLQHAQEGLDRSQTPVYAEMRWMVRKMLSPIEDDPWSDL
jgi:hypothetical protein